MLALMASGSSFTYVSTVVGPTLCKKGHFETAIGHPFGIVFDGESVCYVSSQGTNVVAQVNVASNAGRLGSGCQSPYLTNLFPKPDVF